MLRAHQHQGSDANLRRRSVNVVSTLTPTRQGNRGSDKIDFPSPAKKYLCRGLDPETDEPVCPANTYCMPTCKFNITDGNGNVIQRQLCADCIFRDPSIREAYTNYCNDLHNDEEAAAEYIIDDTQYVQYNQPEPEDPYEDERTIRSNTLYGFRGDIPLARFMNKLGLKVSYTDEFDNFESLNETLAYVGGGGTEANGDLAAGPVYDEGLVEDLEDQQLEDANHVHELLMIGRAVSIFTVKLKRHVLLSPSGRWWGSVLQMLLSAPGGEFRRYLEDLQQPVDMGRKINIVTGWLSFYQVHPEDIASIFYGIFDWHRDAGLVKNEWRQIITIARKLGSLKRMHFVDRKTARSFSFICPHGCVVTMNRLVSGYENGRYQHTVTGAEGTYALVI